jgi:hypothetical protein
MAKPKDRAVTLTISIHQTKSVKHPKYPSLQKQQYLKNTKNDDTVEAALSSVRINCP